MKNTIIYSLVLVLIMFIFALVMFGFAFCSREYMEVYKLTLFCVASLVTAVSVPIIIIKVATKK